MKFNTAIAQLMVFVNAAMRGRQTLCGLREKLLGVPICTSLGEELWQTVVTNIGGVYLLRGGSIGQSDWLLKTKSNRRQIKKVWYQIDDQYKTFHEGVQEVALANDKVKAEIDGKEIVKVISVPNKLVNIVVK